MVGLLGQVMPISNTSRLYFSMPILKNDRGKGKRCFCSVISRALQLFDWFSIFSTQNNLGMYSHSHESGSCIGTQSL